MLYFVSDIKKDHKAILNEKQVQGVYQPFLNRPIRWKFLLQNHAPPFSMFLEQDSITVCNLLRHLDSFIVCCISTNKTLWIYLISNLGAAIIGSCYLLEEAFKRDSSLFQIQKNFKILLLLLP